MSVSVWRDDVVPFSQFFFFLQSKALKKITGGITDMRFIL